MKKLVLLSLISLAFLPLGSQAKFLGIGSDPCSCEVKEECYGCALNKQEVLVKLTPCAYRDKPYNYFTWDKTAEKVVSSGRYDWAAEAEAAQ